MIIGVAGPYSSPDKEQREKNLHALNVAATHLLDKGHTPLIGVNAALPIVALASEKDSYDAMMRISLAVIASCDALVLLAESPGANRERDLVLSRGGTIYHSVDEVPDCH